MNTQERKENNLWRLSVIAAAAILFVMVFDAWTKMRF